MQFITEITEALTAILTTANARPEGMSAATETIGTIAAILTTTSFLPQAIKTMRSGNTRDISLLMYICFVSGVFMWLTFGILIRTRVIVIANTITFLLSGTILVMKLRNLKKDRAKI